MEYVPKPDDLITFLRPAAYNVRNDFVIQSSQKNSSINNKNPYPAIPIEQSFLALQTSHSTIPISESDCTSTIDISNTNINKFSKNIKSQNSIEFTKRYNAIKRPNHYKRRSSIGSIDLNLFETKENKYSDLIDLQENQSNNQSFRRNSKIKYSNKRYRSHSLTSFNKMMAISKVNDEKIRDNIGNYPGASIKSSNVYENSLIFKYPGDSLKSFDYSERSFKINAEESINYNCPGSSIKSYSGQSLYKFPGGSLNYSDGSMKSFSGVSINQHTESIKYSINKYSSMHYRSHSLTSFNNMMAILKVNNEEICDNINNYSGGTIKTSNVSKNSLKFKYPGDSLKSINYSERSFKINPEESIDYNYPGDSIKSYSGQSHYKLPGESLNYPGWSIKFFSGVSINQLAESIKNSNYSSGSIKSSQSALIYPAGSTNSIQMDLIYPGGSIKSFQKNNNYPSSSIKISGQSIRQFPRGSHRNLPGASISYFPGESIKDNDNNDLIKSFSQSISQFTVGSAKHFPGESIKYLQNNYPDPNDKSSNNSLNKTYMNNYPGNLIDSAPTTEVSFVDIGQEVLFKKQLTHQEAVDYNSDISLSPDVINIAPTIDADEQFKDLNLGNNNFVFNKLIQNNENFYDFNNPTCLEENELTIDSDSSVKNFELIDHCDYNSELYTRIKICSVL